VKVGVPTEIKTDEYRVALTPSGVRELVERGHEVVVQAGAGEGSAIADADYEAQGAITLPDADAVFGEADMIVKVKEPQPVEVARLEPRHTLFTYLHLAPDPELTQGLIDSGATCVAYETVEDSRGRLPLLAPMSEVAGKIATQAGAFMLEKPLGGRGILLGGVPGVAAAKVMIIGGGVVGMNAAFMPTTPPPITITLPAATPGTPPSRIPRPPSGFSSMNAPACVAILPATSLIGASSGSRPCASSTVS
jgi:alanine dehydrogenase